MANDSEKQIENAIFKYLSFDRRLFAFKVETMGVFNPHEKRFRKAGPHVVLGTADIIACLDVDGIGIFLALEVKSKQGIQSEKQIVFQWRLEQVSGFYSIVRSIEETRTALYLARKATMDRMEQIRVSETLT